MFKKYLPIFFVASIAAAQAPFPAPAVGHAGAKVSVVASGLADPRGLALSPSGELYVAEAGTTSGVFVPPPPPPPSEPPSRASCSIGWPLGPATPGFTARISRINRHGQRVTVADELPSTGYNALIGGDRMGIAAVAFKGPRLFAITGGGGCSRGHPSEPNALLRVFGNGTTLPLADLSNYLRTSEDSKDPASGDFEPDGSFFNLVRARGAFYTVEPNHGVFLQISERGDIAPIADMIASVAALEGDGDRTYSALTFHDGWFYMGTLGRIDTGFDAVVYKVSPDGRRVRRVASGLHGVTGIAFDSKDRMYVLETTKAGIDPPLSDPTVGRLVRVERNGSLTELVTNLAFPTALVAGHDGEFYVSNCGYHCDDRSAFPPVLTSLSAGQILKVTMPGVRSRCDAEY